MVEIPQQLRDKVQQFQNIQNQLQLIVVQKTQLTQQILEIDNALEELEKYGEGKIYERAGPILIETTKEEIVKKLKDDKELKNARLKSLEKQEAKLRERLNELSVEIQSGISSLSGGKIMGG